jgi:hypothetical protein
LSERRLTKALRRKIIFDLEAVFLTGTSDDDFRPRIILRSFGIFNVSFGSYFRDAYCVFFEAYSLKKTNFV